MAVGFAVGRAVGFAVGFVVGCEPDDDFDVLTRTVVVDADLVVSGSFVVKGSITPVEELFVIPPLKRLSGISAFLSRIVSFPMTI